MCGCTVTIGPTNMPEIAASTEAITKTSTVVRVTSIPSSAAVSRLNAMARTAPVACQEQEHVEQADHEKRGGDHQQFLHENANPHDLDDIVAAGGEQRRRVLRGLAPHQRRHILHDQGDAHGRQHPGILSADQRFQPVERPQRDPLQPPPHQGQHADHDSGNQDHPHACQQQCHAEIGGDHQELALPEIHPGGRQMRDEQTLGGEGVKCPHRQAAQEELNEIRR
jgi:hypothetical protein